MSLPPAAPTAPRRMSRRTVLKWAVTLGILAAMGIWVAFKGGELQTTLSKQWDESKLSFSEFGYGVFLLGFGIYFLGVISTFFRWRVLITALGVPLGIWDSMRL